LFTRTHSSVIVSLFAKLQTNFTLKELSEVSYFLGIQVQCTTTTLHLQQSKYILDLLHKTRIMGAKASRSPCITGSKLSSLDGTPLENAIDYWQLIGGLQYCTLTLPEIAYSVNQLCQHLHSPTSTHWTALKRVLCHLKGSVDHGLFYSKGSFSLQAIVTQIRLVIRMIIDPPRVSMFPLAHVLFPGVLRSSLLWPNPALKLNTRLWLWLLLNFIGYICCSKTFISLSPSLQLFDVTTLVPWH
jgi:hypothetical protein